MREEIERGDELQRVLRRFSRHERRADALQRGPHAERERAHRLAARALHRERQQRRHRLPGVLRAHGG